MSRGEKSVSSESTHARVSRQLFSIHLLYLIYCRFYQDPPTFVFFNNLGTTSYSSYFFSLFGLQWRNCQIKINSWLLIFFNLLFRLKVLFQKYNKKGKLTVGKKKIK